MSKGPRHQGALKDRRQEIERESGMGTVEAPPEEKYQKDNFQQRAEAPREIEEMQGLNHPRQSIITQDISK